MLADVLARARTRLVTAGIRPDDAAVDVDVYARTILGWDRRRVATYVSRGAFPEPIAALASGRVWRREDVEAFRRDRVRRRGRRIAR